MTRPPTFPFRLNDFQADVSGKAQSFQDVFGAYLMWNRQHVMETAAKRISSGAARADLGNIFRRAYDEVAALGDHERAAALKLAEKCVDDFAILMLALLAHNGVDVRLESGEAIRFPLDIEVVDVDSRNVVLREQIAPGAGSFLPDNWGRWLNKNPFKQQVTALEDEKKP
jgi:hypothetical protein